MRAQLLHPSKMEWVDRGSGVASMPLFGGHTEGAKFATGMTRFPPGAAIVLHSHNVDESVTVIEGAGRAEIDGEEFDVETFSTTYVPAGVNHRFINTGDTHMRIMWVYAGTEVTRTIAETGETVVHLSAADRSAASS